MNSVQFLLKHQFSSLTLENKIEIKQLGRHTPDLKLQVEVKSQKKHFTRKFNKELYKIHLWLCGCNVLNAVFCFPCILFQGELPWTKTGVRDLNHINEKIKKHEMSAAHMNNVLNLTMLGTTNIATMLDSAYRKSIELYNENVSKNRYVLNIIINCIRFCGKFELALRGHSETDMSLNPGVFRGLINFSAELDEALKTHLDKSATFKGTSNTIQNELLQCMLAVCHDEISSEIKNATYLAVIADETTDVSNIFQMALVYRYINPEGKPVERFWGFLRPSQHDAESLALCIKNELHRHIQDVPQKLIAQTYDGASVMSGSINGVHAKIKKIYPNAQYVHCYAHQLNLIMSNVASVSRSVRVFFANLGGFCTFFSTSPQRTSILDEVVGKRLPRSVPTRWNFQSRTVNTVYEYRDDLFECMEVIEMEKTEIKHPPTIEKASGLKRTLKDNDFLFWLNFFVKIMPHVDILYNQVQKREIDTIYVKKSVENFVGEITNVRNNITLGNIEESPDNNENEIGNKRRRKEMSSATRNREAIEVCDVIICQAVDRFNFTGHLIASNLFLPEKFNEYSRNFPDDYLRQTVVAYPYFDTNKLRTELSLIYNRSEFHKMSGALALFSFLYANNLDSTFEETIKLLKIIITVPVSSAEAERCFSTLKRIKTFLRNTMSQDRLSSLAMLSIEKDFITNIPNFNNKVIHKFVQLKSRRIDLEYKKV